MSDDIKLSPINQKIVQDKQNNQNSANVNVKVPDNGLKQDTFVNRHKKIITFGSILGGIGLAVGTAFLAYKGKLGSKAQGFVENIVNKFSGNAATVTSKTAPAVSTKTPASVPMIPIDVQDKVEIPQKPIQEAVQEAIEQPVITKPVVHADSGKVVPDTPIKTESKASSSLSAKDDKLPEVKSNTDKVAQEPMLAGADKMQTEKTASEVAQTSEISKVVHDISGGAESYEVKLKFQGSDEEITLIAPHNPKGNNPYSLELYERLKNSRYGEGGVFLNWDLSSGSDRLVKGLQKGIDKIIAKINGSDIQNDRIGKNLKLLLVYVKKTKKLTQEAQAALQEIISTNDAAVVSEKYNSATRDEIVNFLTDLKENILDMYKKAILDNVDNIYDFIDKNIPPLKKTFHCYRGVSSGCWFNESADGNDLYMNYLRNLKVGNTVTPNHAAMFVASSPKYCAKYASKDGVLFHIILPQGAKIETFSSSTESLLPPMAKFKVVGNKQVGKDGFRVIDLEYLIDQGTRSL